LLLQGQALAEFRQLPRGEIGLENAEPQTSGCVVGLLHEGLYSGAMVVREPFSHCRTLAGTAFDKHLILLIYMGDRAFSEKGASRH
jgi:hypothetical protein